MANLTSQLSIDLQPDDWLFRHTGIIWSQPEHLGMSYRCENKPQKNHPDEMLAVVHTWTNESLVYQCMHLIVVESVPYYCVHTKVSFSHIQSHLTKFARTTPSSCPETNNTFSSIHTYNVTQTGTVMYQVVGKSLKELLVDLVTKIYWYTYYFIDKFC